MSITSISDETLMDQIEQVSCNSQLSIKAKTRLLECLNKATITEKSAFSRFPLAAPPAQQTSSHIDSTPPPLESSLAHFVFVGSRYVADHSFRESLPKKVVALPLDEALRTYGVMIDQHFESLIKKEENLLLLSHLLQTSRGLFLYIPPGCILEAPIEILLLNELDTIQVNNPRLTVFMGRGSSLKILVREHTDSSSCIASSFLIMAQLEEGSHLSVNDFWTADNSKNPSSRHVRATLKASTTFKTLFLTPGSHDARYDAKILLTEENAEANLTGLWLLNDHMRVKTHIEIEHLAPYCRSMQLFKGVVNDTAYSVFEGKITVEKEAQKTEAYQLNNNLLTGPHSRAESCPNLKIFADDVKASHGSTIGQINEDQLFYLAARGISAESGGKRLLLKGFCEEIISTAQIPQELKNEVISWIR